MQITLELPEDIARGLGSKWKDLPRAARCSVSSGRERPSAEPSLMSRRDGRRQFEKAKIAGTLSILDEADQAGSSFSMTRSLNFERPLSARRRRSSRRSGKNDRTE